MSKIDKRRVLLLCFEDEHCNKKIQQCQLVFCVQTQLKTNYSICVYKLKSMFTSDLQQLKN